MPGFGLFIGAYDTTIKTGTMGSMVKPQARTAPVSKGNSKQQSRQASVNPIIDNSNSNAKNYQAENKTRAKSS